MKLSYLSFPSIRTRVTSIQTREAKAIIRRAPAHLNFITDESDSLSSQMQTFFMNLRVHIVYISYLFELIVHRTQFIE